MRQRTIALLAVLALLLALLAGCGGQDSGPDADPGGSAAPTERGEEPTGTRPEDQSSGAVQPDERDNPEDQQDTPEESPERPDAQPAGPAPGEGQPPDPGPEEENPEAEPAPEPESEPEPELESEPESEPEPAPSSESEPEPDPESGADPAEAYEDGLYLAEVTLAGGSGRASIESPAQLRCENGQFFATIVWSSSNYDYMKVDGERYDPVNSEGNSTFEIPVAAFDQALDVIADTIAMSEPHEVEYTLTFDSTTLRKQ